MPTQILIKKKKILTQIKKKKKKEEKVMNIKLKFFFSKIPNPLI
jgi:hypothetical protein